MIFTVRVETSSSEIASAVPMLYRYIGALHDIIDRASEYNTDTVKTDVLFANIEKALADYNVDIKSLADLHERLAADE